MKKLLSLLTVLIVCIAALVISASAATVASGTCGDNLIWTLDDTNTLTILGSGDMEDYAYSGAEPWYYYSPSITKVVLSKDVTSIGESAFAAFYALTDVNIPDDSCLTKVGGGAFAHCESLQEIAFPASVESLGGFVFQECYALERVTFPEDGALKDLGVNTFYFCTELAELTLPEDCGMTTLKDGVFTECWSLTSFTVPGTVETIEAGAFHSSGLQQIFIPDSVTSIGMAAFYWCYSLTDVYFGGTEAQWNQANPDNIADVPAEAVIHFGKIGLTAPTTSLSIKAANGKPQLKWNTVLGAEKYEIWRAVGKNSGYSKIFTTTKTTYVNTSAVAGTTYYYKVRAVGEGGKSDFSAAKYITCDCAQPVTTLKNKTANGKPQLSWNAVTGASKYEVWRAEGKNSGYTKMLTTTGTIYTNTSAVAGKTYYYKVRAICKTTTAGNSAFSTAKYVTCDCAQPVVSVKLNANDKPRLSWEKVTGASKYEIWRAVGQDSGYKKIYTLTGNVFTNSSVEEGETYYYKVRAVCGASSYGNSAFSTAKSVTVPIPLNIVSQPEDASAALGGKAKFTVEAEGIGLTYQWQYCTAKGTKWTNTTLTGNKTDTLTVGVTAGRDGYKYRCVITDVNGDSVTSAYGKLTVK